MINFNRRIACVFLCSLIFANSGCIKHSSTDTGGSELDATVNGMDAGDANLPGIKYSLVCTQAAAGNQAYSVDASSVNATQVVFPDSKISLGDQCALEITANPTSPNSSMIYVWLSSPQKQGLFYSSNYDTVKVQTVNGKSTKALSFKLFKVYGMQYKDAFNASITVQFQLEDAGATLPGDNTMIANIQCGNGNSYTSGNPTDVPNQPLLKTFVFSLSASVMNGVACQTITVASNNISIYSGSLTAVTFTGPQAGQALTFAGPFTITSVLPTAGIVQCISNVPGAQTCNVIQLPRPQNFWFALVDGTAPGGGDNLYLVMPASGISLDTVNVYGINDFQQGLTDTTRFKWVDPNFAQEVIATITNSDFTPSANNANISQYQSGSFDMTGVTLQYIKSVFVHEFKTVSDGMLNSKSSPRWFVNVTATNGTQTANFIVGGAGKYFLSTSKPGGNLAYFSWNDYINNRTGPNKLYTMYSFTGGASQPAQCNVSFSYYVDNLSNETSTDMSQTDQNLENCIVNPIPNTYDSWNISVRDYLWDWQEFDF